MKVAVTVARDDASQRADRYLRRYLAKVTLTRIQSLFRRKEIKVNGKHVPGNHLLAEGDLLEVYGLTEEQVAGVEGIAAGPDESSSRWLPFPIIHEDEGILVVDKPSGMAVHPGTGITPGHSLIELAQAYLGPKGDSLFQPALVHRLDRETSGVLLIAKTGGMLRALTAALRAGEIRKEYCALLHGRPDPEKGTLQNTLDRIDSRSGGAKSIISDEEGKEAITHYEVVAILGSFTLVRAIIETGRMHQIRAQFSHAGWPVAGDRRYGGPDAARLVRNSLGLRHLFLHAERLTWRDGRNERVFVAPLPKDLTSVLNRCRETN
jgi:23S rRNA pseudouridine955/2504/2580 synthase